MIDTDKFTEHTQGHWGMTTREGTWVVYTQDNGDVATMNNYEDAKLISKAPLLLAEVKRLQHEIEIKKEALAKSQSSYKQLRKRLKAAIE